jgi:putative transposase
MLKSFKYRLKFTRKQATQAQSVLGECRWLYNHLLEQKKTAWEERQESLNYYSQANTLPELKAERTSLLIVHSQVLQNVAVRIDLAFKAFFRRVKAGEEPGYPRFRGYGQYDSFTYPQPGFGWKLEGNSLKLSKIGKIRVILHRPLEGAPKTCTIKRTSTGKWFVCFSCEVEAVPLPATTETVGIDVGLLSFAALSTGDTIPAPKFFRKDEKDLARKQRKLSKAGKGTPERKKAKKAVSKIHERIANRRCDFAHQQSRKIINRFGMIAIEDLEVNQMLHNHCLAKSISDAAWSQFAQFLSYKAEYAGRRLARVNPAYTSQDCSACGHRQKMPLTNRLYLCPCCGLSIDRDHNAALNILRLGLQSLG